MFKFDVAYRLFVRKVDVAEPRLVAKSGAIMEALKALTVDVLTEFTKVVEVT